MPGTASLEQRRARHAWKAVAQAKEKLDENERKDYGRETKRLPVRIMTSGLGVSLAFLRAKGGRAREQLTDDVAGWLGERKIGPSRQDGRQKGSRNGKALVQEIVERDSDFLRLATDETLLYGQWLSRFAEAEIGPVED